MSENLKIVVCDQCNEDIVLMGIDILIYDDLTDSGACRFLCDDCDEYYGDKK